MKKIVSFSSLLIGLLIITNSCKKSTTSGPVRQTITYTMKNTQSYQFDLGSFGDEEGATISRQASYFVTSSVDREINTGKVIYKYVPATNYIGPDEVEIKSAKGSNGASPNNKITYTTIKFIITN